MHLPHGNVLHVALLIISCPHRAHKLSLEWFPFKCVLYDGGMPSVSAGYILSARLWTPLMTRNMWRCPRRRIKVNTLIKVWANEKSDLFSSDCCCKIVSWTILTWQWNTLSSQLVLKSAHWSQIQPVARGLDTSEGGGYTCCTHSETHSETHSWSNAQLEISL